MKSTSQLLLVLIIVASLMQSCLLPPRPLQKSDLVGSTAIEIYQLPNTHYIDTTFTSFGENDRYLRTGSTYIQLEGKYEVRNDTLEIHYSCNEPCDNASCGVQRYTIGEDGNLHLAFLRDKHGKKLELANSNFMKTMELTGKASIK